MKKCNHSGFAKLEPHFDYDVCLECGQKFWHYKYEGLDNISGMTSEKGIPALVTVGRKTEPLPLNP